MENVNLLPPIDRADLVEEYKKADVLFLHLNDHAAFEKVLPSKLFEYAAMGKPIWAGVSGYSLEFIKSEISNCEVFVPCNVTDAINKFDADGGISIIVDILSGQVLAASSMPNFDPNNINLYPKKNLFKSAQV